MIKEIICNDTTYTDERDVVENLKEYFTSVGSAISNSIRPNHIDPLTYMEGSYPRSFFYSHVRSSDVNEVLLSFKNKNCSLTAVPLKIFKYISDIVSPVLATLINKSFLSGKFPECLKIARVIPLYKGENPSNMNNYRPISILSNFAKIYEKVLYKQLYEYIEKHNILYKHQYGFRNRKSTTQAIYKSLIFLIPI